MTTVPPDTFDVQEFLLWEAASRDTIDFKKIYVDITEDLVTGLLLSQIVFWHLPNTEGHTKLRAFRDGHHWLVKSQEDWWEECRLTVRQAQRGLTILKKKRLVTTEIYRFNGTPKTHIRILWPQFLAAWRVALIGKMDFDESAKSSLAKAQSPSSPKGKNDFPENARSITETTAENTTETTAENTTTPTSVLPSEEGKTQQAVVGVVDHQKLKDFLLDVGVWDFIVEQILNNARTSFETAATWWAYLKYQDSVQDKPAVLASHLTKANPPPQLKNHHQRAKLTEIFVEYGYTQADEEEDEEDEAEDADDETAE